MDMDMSSTATMAGMPMSTDHASSSSNSMAHMSGMTMTFFLGSSTPLFTDSWTPTSTGQYAGTCIFLIVFAAIFRALLALRVNLYDILFAVKKGRGDDQVGLYESGGGEGKGTQGKRRKWRASEAVLSGVVDVVIATVGYLLMIAVMTMNVGYFLSVLAGIFVGSVAFGRFLTDSAAH